MIGGFFPTPYPDECLYSVLCRYSSHCGNVAYEVVTRMLFGGLQNLAATIYLPIKSERADYWVTPESGITRANIATDHTLYPYYAMTYTPKLRTEADRVLNGGTPTATHDRTMVLKSRRSWLKHLRYCPLCAAEDIVENGETYWHRKHQFPGSYFCTRHLIRLVDSPITVKMTTTAFYSASNVVKANIVSASSDLFKKHKDKCLKIGEESEWLLENGLSVDWSENGREKYVRLFRDKGIATVNGTRCDAKALSGALNEYWGSEFIDKLFSEVKIFPEWLSRIHETMMSRFLPLQHILLMCLAKGSVDEFVSCEATEHPFGTAPYVCENPICAHYRVDGADCTDVRVFNSRVVGYFHCRNCGMKYKISKSKYARGIPVILDYGHLWINELIRCSRDKTITNERTAEILKCDIAVMMLQKKKLGLLRPYRYDVGVGPELFYKTKVLELREKHGEVTYSLLRDYVPGAYDYLGDNFPDWFREHVVHQSDTLPYRQKSEALLGKAKEAVAHIIENNCPKRQITFGYIAEVAGVTRDNLRDNKHTRTYLEGIIESKESWYKRRIVITFHNSPHENRGLSALEICRKASIEPNTYKKYQNFFEGVVQELKTAEH